MHLAIVAVIVAGVIGSVAIPSALPGNASTGEQAPVTAVTQPPPFESASARTTFAAPQQQVLSQQQPAAQPPADNLVLAVVALESSDSPEERDSSINRIHTLGVPKQIPEPTATPEATEEPACAETGSAAFCVYTVSQGDTLSGIAGAMGFAGNESISAAEMLAQSNKPDVVSSDQIVPGQNIRVPRETGILHTVFSSETVSDIAEKYGVSADAIIDSPYNDISAGSVITIGEEILVPDPQQLPANEPGEAVFEDDPTETPTEEATEEPTEEPTEEATEAPTGEATEAPAEEATQESTATPTPSPTPSPTARPSGGNAGRFIWPVTGPISSPFGPSHPLGIDIDLYATPNADIAAARGGTVVFAGGDKCCSYGLYVIVDHGRGVQTLYAHLSSIDVSVGDKVDQGDVLGQGGHTGYATGDHLHFEVRVNDAVVDPMKYLP